MPGYFIVSLLLVCGTSYAAPPIKWTPPKLKIEQMQGTSSIFHASIEATDNVQGLVARVVPELHPWVTISPAFIGNLVKGQHFDLTVDINIPPDEEIGKSIEGTIQLKQNILGKPYKVIAKPLPLNLTITKFIDRGLPPAPGSAGTQSLLGIDNDSDGVRDDIQRYIHFTYPNETRAVKLALREYAKQFQLLLPNAGDKEAAFYNATKMDRHGECLFYLKGEVSADILANLRSEILNTRERSTAYIKYSDNLGGQILLSRPYSTWKSSCAFNVDTMGGAL